MDGSSRSKEWVTKGLISACECFSCMNKLDHRLIGNRVRVLCRNPCNFMPVEGVVSSPLEKIHDIEQES